MNVTKRDVLNFVHEMLQAPKRAKEISNTNQKDGSALVCVVYDILNENFPEMNIEKWEVNLEIK